jgi:hypothetical protein
MPPGERPAGVLLLAILYILNAIVAFVGAAFAMFVGAAVAGMAGLICTAPFLLLGVFFLIVAFGLLAMKSWAWIVGLVFAILGLLGGIGGAASGNWVSIANLILNLIIIVYLFKVKEYFR